MHLVYYLLVIASLSSLYMYWAIAFNIRTPPVEEQRNSSGLGWQKEGILQGLGWGKEGIFLGILEVN